MSPSTTNAVILPSLPQKLLLGLDTLALTPSPRFLGLKDIPSGWHFLYAGADSALSTRTGYWIHIPDTASASQPWVRVFKWNDSNEVLEPSADADETAYWRGRILDSADRELTVGLLPYEFDASDAAYKSAGSAPVSLPERADLEPLTSCVTPALLGHLTGTPSPSWDGLYIFSTSSSSPEDRDDIPGLSDAERKFTTGPLGAVIGEERELSFLGIDLKRTWREGAVGRERTVDARDRSAALERVAESAGIWSSQREAETSSTEQDWGAAVIGEMQITFLMILLVSNWSCLEEWRRLLELVLTSKRLVLQQPDFFATFLQVLHLQLQRCDDVEGGLFDVSGESANFLKQHLRDFRSTIKDLDSQGELDNVKEEMQELEDWIQQEWGWILDGSKILKKGMVELEDGEKVEMQLEGFDADDETGEYAPVVVDLG